MITIGDVQNGKKKLDDPGNPKIFPHMKAYNKHFGVIIGAGLMVILGGAQVVQYAVDFCCSRSGQNNDRRDGRR